MSDRIPSPEDIDTLLAGLGSRTAAGQVIADLRVIAAHLRKDTSEIGAALASIAGAPDPPPETSRAIDVDPLTRFAIRRGTDKWGPHFYTPIYHELFQYLRHQSVRILEIGVGGHESTVIGGGSLFMWADYFPHARIVGIDIAEKRLEAHPRITVLRGSQDDEAFLRRVEAEHGPFDIVIDDGSHRPAHVRASFDVLFPLLAERGTYVVEDVQAAFWPQFGGSRTDGAETMALARSALEGINHAEIKAADQAWIAPPMAASLRCLRAYHNLLVFEKGDNREPSTRDYHADDPHVIGALAVMEQELASMPTPEGLARLARTYALARQFDKAIATVERGLERWPDHPRLYQVGELIRKTRKE